MRILIESGIAYSVPAFSHLGKLSTFKGRSLSPQQLSHAEALIVRSTTEINGAVLEKSPVKFVATTSAGVDHINIRELEDLGVKFVSASGCNALSVAEHVICCIYAYSKLRRIDPRSLTVGVVGFGHVGSALGALLKKLGIRFFANDPPLNGKGGFSSSPLDQCLKCTVVTLHVPLLKNGEHKTVGLVGADEIEALMPNSLLINTARGGVLDERALLNRIHSRSDIYTAIDCWEGEPSISNALLQKATYASPHIAGHTAEARLRATLSASASLADFLGNDRKPSIELSRTRKHNISLVEGTSVRSVLDVLSLVHDLGRLKSSLMAGAEQAPRLKPEFFDKIRGASELRREFKTYRIRTDDFSHSTAEELKALGFSFY